jgi:hypothetical protein
MYNERFLECRRSKLISRGDGPIQILEIINDNAYKVNLLGEYSVSATFNISEISLFNVGDDSKSTFFRKRGDDAIQSTPNDLLEVPVKPITRSREKKLKDAFNELIQSI